MEELQMLLDNKDFADKIQNLGIVELYSIRDYLDLQLKIVDKEIEKWKSYVCKKGFEIYGPTPANYIGSTFQYYIDCGILEVIKNAKD